MKSKKEVRIDGDKFDYLQENIEADLLSHLIDCFLDAFKVSLRSTKKFIVKKIQNDA